MADAAPTPASTPASTPAPTGGRYLAFRAGGQRYALPAGSVAEVVAVPPLARMPLSPPCLLGLANLRGAVIPVVSLAVLMGRETSPAGRAIVIGGEAPLALPVDAVETLESADADRLAPLAAAPGEVLLGGYRAGAADAVTKVLDLPGLLATAFATNRAARAIAPVLPPATAAAAEPVHPPRLIVPFEIAGQEYALPLEAVEEIGMVPQAVSIVPRADAVLLGVVGWRDGLLALVSLRALLGFPPAATRSGRERLVVAICNGSRVGLVVDRALPLVPAQPDAIDPAPPMLAARSGGEARIEALWRGDGGNRLVSLLAPAALFREDTMAQLAATPLLGPTAARSDEVSAFVVFRLGEDHFALPVESVAEVAHVPAQVTRVPKMPAFLEGLVNLRGEVLPVVDQRRRFGLPAMAATAARRLVVVRAGDHRAGLIVDAVSEVLRVPADAIHPPPELTFAGARVVNGVVSEARRMVLLLDPAELLTGAERRDLDRLAQA